MQVTKVWWDGEKLMADPIDSAAIYKEPEQPAQQNPVAIVASHPERVDWLRDEPPDGTLLYTTPPQRKPLTDEEIESINVRLAGKRDLARLFARAIEAAHGIKGDA